MKPPDSSTLIKRSFSNEAIEIFKRNLDTFYGNAAKRNSEPVPRPNTKCALEGHRSR